MKTVLWGPIFLIIFATTVIYSAGPHGSGLKCVICFVRLFLKMALHVAYIQIVTQNIVDCFNVTTKTKFVSFRKFRLTIQLNAI